MPAGNTISTPTLEYPFEVASDAVAQGGADVRDHFLHPGLRRWRRCFFHIQFAKCVAEQGVNAADWRKAAARRAELNAWLTYKVRPLFSQRVLDVTEDVAFKCRLLVEEGRKAGHMFSQ